MFKKVKIFAGLLAAAMIISNTPDINAAAESEVAINKAHFPDADFRDAISVFDTNGNGSLSKSERENVINLHCENRGIVSVKGIEYFPNLQGLWCLNNKISEWDLSGNPELVGIWCSHNSFTSLDFTGLDKLEWVYCYNCKLSSINFRNNPKLAYVECNENPNLKKLDISQNPLLENLFCSGCGLTSLDLTNNPLLCELDAFKNKLTSLDVSKNKYLKRLDIWDNEKLGNVDISGLTGLEFYNCANNNVTSLDMSKNSQLQLLICGYNENLKYLNVTKNPRLADLRLECDYRLTSLDLSGNPQLYNLYAFGLRDLPSVNISSNPYLIKTYTEGAYKDEPQLGYVHSYTVEYGGSEEYFEDLTHCLVVDNKKPVVVTGGKPKVISECYYDTADGHSESEVFATRGQAVLSLWKSAGRPEVSGTSRFQDVTGTSYEQAVKWAENNNICFGYPSICSDNFCPEELINRQDFALMAHRFALYMKLGTAFDYGRTDWFRDFYYIDYYGWGAFTWAVQFEVLTVNGDFCYPHGRMTVEELDYSVNKLFNLDPAASYSAIVDGNGTSAPEAKVVPYHDGNTGKKYSLPAPSGKSGVYVSGLIELPDRAAILKNKPAVDKSKHYDSKKVTGNKLKKGLKFTDKKSGGRYVILKVTKKKGKITGGTVKYIAPYNLNTKAIKVPNTVKLARVTFKVTKVGANCGKGCRKLTKVTIGKNVISLGKNSFKGCKKLKTIVIRSAKIKTFGKGSFKGISKKATVKVPKKKLKKYKKLLKKTPLKKKLFSLDRNK